MFDFGYDVSDYKKIDPIFGTIEDFDNLRKVTKQKGIKLLLDFVPNHNSEKHEWFQKSAMNDTKYIDYYIWANGRVLNDTYERLPPNNWLSKFGGSAWTWNEDRGQYYLHKYLSQQPDLNYRNPNVSMEMKDVLTYWLEKGVDGFRIDAVSSLFEDKNLTFENRSDDMNAKPGNYKSLNHSSTINQPENHVLIAEWRKLVDEYSKKDGKTRILIVQSSGDFSEVTAYFGSKNNPEAHFPFNFGLISGISNKSNAQDIKRIIETWSSVETKNWVMVDIMNMLVLLLPGTAVTYYGEEIGMEDTPIKWENIKDSACLSTGRKKHALLCRDFERTPFQWDNTENAGFSTSIGKIWLPVNSQYNEVNLKNQMDSDRSIYKTYKRLIEARKEPAVQSGSLNITVPNDNILTFSRDLEGHKSFVVIMNLGKTQLPIDLSMYNALKGNVTVYASSLNSSFTM
ncbi:Maltase 2 [Blattella germanica]|nr:Maltase 2 [Blattella germanica]